jgi:hypothetical protein
VNHDDRTAELARRIVADPGAESAWLAYARDLADNGHDREAVVVRVYWFRLAAALRDGDSFDCIVAQVRRNVRTLHRAAAQIAETEYDPPDS